MVTPEERYDNTIKNGVIYAQVEPRIEMLRPLELDIRSQAEVRVAAQIVLMYQCDKMLSQGVSAHYIEPFQASHAVMPRKINGHSPDERQIQSYAAPHLTPEGIKPVLDELLLRGWEHALQEHGYTFSKADGLAYSIGVSDEDCPEVFDPVILAIMEPKPKDSANPTASEQKVLCAFDDLETKLIGGFGLLMKRFNPRNLIH